MSPLGLDVRTIGCKGVVFRFRPERSQTAKEVKQNQHIGWYFPFPGLSIHR